MPRWRWRGGRRGPGRPFSELFLSSTPTSKKFVPQPCLNSEPVEVSYPEYEAVKLLDFEDLTQEEAAEKMKTSRGTVWRLARSGRKKILQALTQSRPLIILKKGEVKRI
jgi:hypothetical protein